MTSHELARQLLEGPDELVLIASDPEGNDFHKFQDFGVSLGWALKYESYRGRMTDYSITHPDDKDEYDEEEWASRVPFVVLWP